MLSAARQKTGTRCGRLLTLTVMMRVSPGAQRRLPAAMTTRTPARIATGDAVLRTRALHPWVNAAFGTPGFWRR